MTQTHGSYADLAAASGGRAVADPLTLCLPAGSPVNRHTPLDWVEARSWADGSGVLVRVLDHVGALLIGGASFAGEVRERLGTPPDRFTIVPGAVDTSRFTPERQVGGERNRPGALLPMMAVSIAAKACSISSMHWR